MKILGMHLYREKKTRKTIRERMQKASEAATKIVIMITCPAVPATISVCLWYQFLFKHGMCFDGKSENIVVGGWLVFCGVFYGLLASGVFGNVYNEYKDIRMANKEYNIEKFMNLVDEEISPLVYVMIIVSSLPILAGFLLLDYSRAIYGIAIIGSTAYFLFFFLFVISEIDDPCAGIWFIKNIHEEWLDIDPKLWREETSKQAYELVKEKIAKCTDRIAALPPKKT